jgi:predicted SnoaL-like aldol condensation-catalyzing enzyme
VDERLEAVQNLWATYREEGVERAIPLLDPEVEFVDHEGRAFHGHDGVRRFFDEFEQRGERFIASPYSFELHEPDLVVIGHRRIQSEDGTRGDYLFFVHSFRDGRVSRIAAHTTKEAALADIAERYRGQAWPS